MSDMSSTVTLEGGMAFDVAIGEHHFMIDAMPEHGGDDRGPGPKALMLSALAGCTGMDVIAILRKMRQPVEAFTVRADADRTTEGHPVTLEHIVVTFGVNGQVDPRKLWKAVMLSHDRYCGVSAMIEKATPVSVRVVLNGTEIPKPE